MANVYLLAVPSAQAVSNSCSACESSLRLRAGRARAPPAGATAGALTAGHARCLREGGLPSGNAFRTASSARRRFPTSRVPMFALGMAEDRQFFHRKPSLAVYHHRPPQRRLQTRSTFAQWCCQTFLIGLHMTLEHSVYCRRFVALVVCPGAAGTPRAPHQSPKGKGHRPTTRVVPPKPTRPRGQRGRGAARGVLHRLGAAEAAPTLEWALRVSDTTTVHRPHKVAVECGLLLSPRGSAGHTRLHEGTSWSCSPPPPFVKATPMYTIITVPTPTVAWTRAWLKQGGGGVTS